MTRWWLTIVLGILAAGPGLADTADPQEAVRLLGDLAGSVVVVVADDGSVAAAAFANPDKPRRSVLRLANAGTGSADEIDIPGVVRSLLFDRSGFRLYAVISRITKQAPSTSYLMEVEIESLRGRRLINLPVSATAIADWPESESIVVACQDELRSYVLPDLRSGPLFRVIGKNLAIANVPGTDGFVIGKEDAVVLVDLSDRHGEEEMPRRWTVPTESPVIAVRITEDGERFEATTESGGSMRVALATLQRPVERVPDPAPAGTPESPTGESALPGRSEPPSPPVLAGEATAVAGATAKSGVAPVRADGPGEPSKAPPASGSGSTAPAVSAAAVAEAGRDLPTDKGAAVGSVRGDQATIVRWVVLYGPDNLLREASRVEVGADGTWTCTGLPPGSYRVMLDAGGDHAVYSDPGFRIVDLLGGRVTEVPAFRVLRVE